MSIEAPTFATENKEKKTVKIGNIEVGGKLPILIGGPCMVEDFEQLEIVADALRKISETTGLPVVLRGGVNKPRTKPSGHQGLGEEGLEMLVQIRDKTGILIATEIRGEEYMKYIENSDKRPDLPWIGSRNGLNQDLIGKAAQAAQKAHVPIMIKRNWGATVEEWMGAVGYAANAWGHEIKESLSGEIILCERGIRVGDLENPLSKTILDLTGMREAQEKSGRLPVIVDPSHGTRMRDRVLPASIAAIQAGADGLIIEIHPTPEKAKSDPSQQITPEEAIILAKAIVDPEIKTGPIKERDWIRWQTKATKDLRKWWMIPKVLLKK